MKRRFAFSPAYLVTFSWARTECIYDMDEKLKRLRAGGRNPFIDPEGYRAYIKEREQAFRAELSVQQQTR
jgi:hypothetical protein